MEDHDRPITRSAEDARQGEIILRRRWQKIVFLGGLAALVLIVIVLRVSG